MATMTKGTIEIYRDRKGAWRWRKKARNGEIVASGQGYTRKHSVKRALGRDPAALKGFAIVELGA